MLVAPEKAARALCRSSMAAMSLRGAPLPAERLFSFSQRRIALEFHLRVRVMNKVLNSYTIA